MWIDYFHRKRLGASAAASAGDLLHGQGPALTYTIRGRELFVDRRQKSITISTVEKALEKIGRLQADGIAITGPKKIGCYGASYLYPVLLALGIFSLPTPEEAGQLHF